MLTDAQLHAYRRDGYLIAPLLSAGMVAAVRANLTRLARQVDGFGQHPSGYHVDREPDAPPGADPELAVRKFRDIALADAFFWDLARDPAVLGPLADLHGAGPRLLQTMALVKPPGIGSAKDWHQDIPYFPLDQTHTTVGVWIAIDDATLENGCMQVIPGSHHLGPVAHVQGPTGWRLEPALCAHLAPAVRPLPMAAGEALLFDGRLLHFTDHNRSPHRRRAVQNHYVGPTCAIAPGRTGALWDLSATCPPFLAAAR